MVGRDEDALDVTQWTFLRLMEVPFEHRSDAETLSWLYRTATRRCLEVLRARKRHRRLNQEHADALRPPALDLEAALAQREVVERALHDVDDRCGQVALMTVFQGLSVARTAEALEISDRTVIRERKRFARVIQRLLDEAVS